MLKVAENIKTKSFLFNLENIYFPTMPVGFNFNLTVGLKPQVGGIKIVTVYKRSIFQVEWLIATLVKSIMINEVMWIVSLVDGVQRGVVRLRFVSMEGSNAG